MPTLYTSLLARSRGTQTLAPREQRPPVPKETQTLSLEQYTEHVSADYADAFSQLVAVAPPTRSIAVVGAGLAGLSVSYELRKRGYDVTIFEASDRVGGRTFSNHDLAKPHVMERGGELIGSNHPLWLHYADTFHLGFSDVTDYENSPVRLGKDTLSKSEAKILFKQMSDAFDFISASSKRIVDPFRPWTEPDASLLDQQNVYEFVMQRRKWSGLCKKAILQQLEADNGVLAEDQSLLGLLSMVRGGGMERYWLDTEVYRCKRGAQALSIAFEAALLGMRTSVHYNNPVTAIDATGPKVKLEVNQKSSGSDFDDVVLAIAPSAWINISKWLPDRLAQLVGSPPQMGKNIKMLLAFRSRVWEKDRLAPSSTENGPVDETWETTESYSSPKFGMVAFSGAHHAAELSKLDDKSALNRVEADLQDTYKGLSSEVTDSEFVNWPTRDWAWASYSFPKCGDITRWGPIFNEGYEERLHFAGEHTCYAFTGYMEGALQSGYRLARKLVLRDGKDWPQSPIMLRPPSKSAV
jgi:monoamine oxidase